MGGDRELARRIGRRRFEDAPGMTPWPLVLLPMAPLDFGLGRSTMAQCVDAGGERYFVKTRRRRSRPCRSAPS